MHFYIIVFFASFLVDLVPFVGPPAWTVMVFLQMKYSLNIWAVLVAGVVGSTVGRYMLSVYMPYISDRFVNSQKRADIEFIGNRLSNDGWKVRLFVLIYTLVPLPSTPLFTAAGMARIRPLHFIPSFLVGKFVSDMVMVLAGDHVARNAVAISEGLLSWKSIFGMVSGLIIIVAFLCIDWRMLIQYRKFRLNFKIWK